MRLLNLANAIALTLTVALATVSLSLSAAHRAAWRAIVAAAQGDTLIVIRHRVDADGIAEWQVEDLVNLSEIEGIEQLGWHGGVRVVQHPDLELLIPTASTSPGWLTLHNTHFVAGRDLQVSDIGAPHIVISESIASQLSAEQTASALLGQPLTIDRQTYTIVGIYQGTGVALRVAERPDILFGSADINTVVLRAHTGRQAEVVRMVNRQLAAVPRLRMLEAVSFAAFVNPEVSYFYTPFVREIFQLAGVLGWLAVALAALNLLNQSYLLAHAQQRTLALVRVLGASRWSLARDLWFQAWRRHGVAVLVGIVLASAIGHLAGGRVTPEVVILGALIGMLCSTVGALPLIIQAMSPYPYRTLTRSMGSLRRPVVAITGSVGLMGAVALLVVASGFRDLGTTTIVQELRGIGMHLIELSPDPESLRPRAILNTDDFYDLQERFPEVPMVLLTRQNAQLAMIQPNEIGLVAAVGDFATVSGTVLSQLEGIDAVEFTPAILGAEVARAVTQNGVFEPLSINSPTAGILSVTPVAVADTPSTHRLESIQLAKDSVLVYDERLVNNSPAGGRLYLLADTLSEADQASIAAVLSQRHANSAPFVPRPVARTYRERLARLTAVSQTFNRQLVVIFSLALVGVTTVLLTIEQAKVYTYALHRTLGATKRAILAWSIRRAVTLATVIGGAGSALGLVLWLVIATRRNYMLSLPVTTLGLVSLLLIALAIAVAMGVFAALRSNLRPPLEVLRGER